MSDIKAIAQSISNSIEKANSEFEKSWQAMADLSEKLQAKEEKRIALLHLMAYNPQNSSIGDLSAPHSEASELISNRIVELQKIIQQNGKDVAAWVQLGHCYLSLNDYPNAYSSYTRVVNLDPKNADGFFNFCAGIVYQHFKYYSNAIQFFKKASNSKLINQGDLQLRLALVHRLMGDYDMANTILTTLPNPPEALISDDIRLQLAFTNQLAERDSQALLFYQELYARRSSSLSFLQQYLWFLTIQKDSRHFNTAEQIINSLSPEIQNDPTIKLLNARLAMKQQDMSNAYKRYCDCINYWSDTPLFWCGLGTLYLKNDQTHDAIVAFQRALYIKSDLVEAWLNLGLIFEMQNDLDNAIKIYQAGLQNCQNSQVLRERHQNLSNGRTNVKDPVLEVSDTRFFVQPAEKSANIILNNIPKIPANLMGMDNNKADILSVLYSHQKSFFQ